MYTKQEEYEQQLERLGLLNKDAFTCTCYMDEVGNVPRQGEVLSWSESSAVVYANSVLGARCNRNSGIIDLMGSVLGYVPRFGLLTDEGRKASWVVEIRTSKKPEAQLLGSAIGMKVMEDVPYIVGLDKWLGTLDEDAKTYLKDFGAATASNGAVGLYHVEGITPEAVQQGRALVSEGARTYVIDDAELERVYKSYPVIWKKQDAPSQAVLHGLSAHESESADCLDGEGGAGTGQNWPENRWLSPPCLPPRRRSSRNLKRPAMLPGSKATGVITVLYLSADVYEQPTECQHAGDHLQQQAAHLYQRPVLY